MMKMNFETSILLIVLFSLFPAAILGRQTDKTDLPRLRKLLNEAVKEDFEWVRDFVDERPVSRGGETYWLVHLKPKRSGHFTLKYTYKYTHKLSHPEEGENDLIVRVGERNCRRYNNDNLGLSNVCLGDTVIVPIQLNQRTEHQFSLKRDYHDAGSFGKTEKSWAPNFTETAEIVSQPDKYLKYLGTVRSVMPHRNYGAQTVVYSAYFEAKEIGRFNFKVSTLSDGERVDDTSKIEPMDTLPIIIINPGIPVTALVHRENTINYSDNKRFSANSGHQFLTNLLILQPGDVFAVNYSSYVEREHLIRKSVNTEKIIEDKKPKLVVYKLPFAVNKDWSYNDWLIDYLPSENHSK